MIKMQSTEIYHGWINKQTNRKRKNVNVLLVWEKKKIKFSGEFPYMVLFSKMWTLLSFHLTCSVFLDFVKIVFVNLLSFSLLLPWLWFILEQKVTVTNILDIGRAIVKWAYVYWRIKSGYLNGLFSFNLSWFIACVLL